MVRLNAKVSQGEAPAWSTVQSWQTAVRSRERGGGRQDRVGEAPSQHSSEDVRVSLTRPP